MMLAQAPLEQPIVTILGADDLNLQRTQRGQTRHDRGRGQALKQVRTRIHTATDRRSPTGRQCNKSSVLKFEQQRPSRHVFELARSGVPLPTLGQDARQLPSTPLWMTCDELLNLAHLSAANPAPLNDL